MASGSAPTDAHPTPKEAEVLFDKLKTPRDAFTFKLGSALKMENKVLDMLGDLEKKASHEELKQQFRHHADETRQHIRNLEMAFQAIGEEPDEHANLVIEAIDKEGKANIKMADDAIADSVILAGAEATEHHEIATYEWLIANAEALGEQQVVPLLQQNLEQEQHTLEEVRQAAQRLARETVGASA
jgi:ferritin-like metal-binding protein YciE